MLILAGGFGTRLKAAVGDVPKALAPVGSLPFLHFQLENWIAQGVRCFVFLLHHQADAIIRFLESEEDRLLASCQVRWIVEPIPLDTGGAIAHAVTELGLHDDFILTNADTWVGTGITRLFESEAPTIAVIRLRDASRYGQVDFNRELTVTAFNEKQEVQKPGWINAGLGLFSAKNFDDWDGSPYSLERDCLPQLAELRTLKAMPIETEFIDIGIPGDYHSFCEWKAAGRRGNL